MSDIYNILSKHFVEETTPDEELLVKQFKLKNPEEYQALQSFWIEKGLNLSQFDTTQGWQKVIREVERPKRVFLYPYLRKAVAIAAIFLLVVTGIYLYNYQGISTELLTKVAATQNDKIKLEDGSIIYLNKYASLSFPKKFDANKREVTLQGEAFFEISKDIKRPFIVHTNHSDVEVLGTSFNINTLDKDTKISVATGKVKIKSLNSNDTSILTPNQSAIVTNQRLDAFPTENKNYLAWKTGIFHFDKTTLQQVVNELNRYYENKITLSIDDAECLFSSSFNQRDLKEIIEIIQLSCGLQLQQKNGNYELF